MNARCLHRRYRERKSRRAGPTQARKRHLFRRTLGVLLRPASRYGRIKSFGLLSTHGLTARPENPREIDIAGVFAGENLVLLQRTDEVRPQPLYEQPSISVHMSRTA